jgi:hypothetical protein
VEISTTEYLDPLSLTVYNTIRKNQSRFSQNNTQLIYFQLKNMFRPNDPLSGLQEWKNQYTVHCGNLDLTWLVIYFTCGGAELSYLVVLVLMT